MYNALAIGPDIKVDYLAYLEWFEDSYSPGCIIEGYALIG